jgi:hypothetical protein
MQAYMLNVKSRWLEVLIIILEVGKHRSFVNTDSLASSLDPFSTLHLSDSFSCLPRFREEISQVYVYKLECDGELSNKTRVKPMAIKNNLNILIATVFPMPSASSCVELG